MSGAVARSYCHLIKLAHLALKFASTCIMQSVDLLIKDTISCCNFLPLLLNTSILY